MNTGKKAHRTIDCTNSVPFLNAGRKLPHVSRPRIMRTPSCAHHTHAHMTHASCVARTMPSLMPAHASRALQEPCQHRFYARPRLTLSVSVTFLPHLLAHACGINPTRLHTDTRAHIRIMRAHTNAPSGARGR